MQHDPVPAIPESRCMQRLCHCSGAMLNMVATQDLAWSQCAGMGSVFSVVQEWPEWAPYAPHRAIQCAPHATCGSTEAG